ncbi:hypothetical protein UMNK88_3317 [Escherichia coli UMNK88]|nr:hypothetical protein UMNK88_3317 [Escherichia coli UMNK88]
MPRYFTKNLYSISAPITVAASSMETMMLKMKGFIISPLLV